MSAVWGFADLHTHPAAHLGFGADDPNNPFQGSRLFWGGPALSLETAPLSLPMDLSTCDANIHSPGMKSIEHPILSASRGALIGGLVEQQEPSVPPSCPPAAHYPHGPNGWPTFDHWPHALDTIHQQMHITWINRAYLGGLRLLIACAVDNQAIAGLWNQDLKLTSSPGPSILGPGPVQLPVPDPNFDVVWAAHQLEFLQQMIDANPSWMGVAQTSAEARQLILGNKLAVILGLEMDSLTVEQIMELKRTHRVGAVIPIHLANNSIGGVAVYNDLFNTSNCFLNGTFYEVTCDACVGFQLSNPQLLLGVSNTGATPVPLPDAAYELLGYCCPPIIPPPPPPTPPSSGHRNLLGLQRAKLQALMAEGLIIDIAHMSEQSQADALDLSSEFQYPLINSHTAIRPDCDPMLLGQLVSERAMKSSHAQQLLSLGGVIGLGTAWSVLDPSSDPVEAWAAKYEDLLGISKSSNRNQQGVAFGTDMNGFTSRIPFTHLTPVYDEHGQVNVPSDSAARAGVSGVGALEKCKLGLRAPFDFSKDGLAHFGLLPDFIQALSKTQLGADGIEPLFHSAEDTIQMWERVEEATSRAAQASQRCVLIRLRMSVGKDEVDGMLFETPGSAIFNPALSVVVDGFDAKALGITTLTPPPAQLSPLAPSINMAPNPLAQGVTITPISLSSVPAFLLPAGQAQRFIFTYQLAFANDSVFPTSPGETEDVSLSTSINGVFSLTTTIRLINELIPPGVIEGTVTDTRGLPISGATVVLVKSYGVISAGYGNTVQLSTDASGRYRSPVVPTGGYTVSASSTGFIPTSTMVTVTAGVPFLTTNFVLVLTLPITVTGYIRDALQAPLGGATVTLAEAIDFGVVTSSTSDSSGLYRVVMDPISYSGNYTVSAAASGFAPASVTIAIPNGATITQDLVLARPGAITGLVSDIGGVPIAGATVTAGAASTRTDSSGHYRLTTPVPGVTTLTAIASGFQSGAAVVTVAPNTTTNQDFKLVKGMPGAMSGTVVDGSDGSAIPTASVTAGSISTSTDGNGLYTLGNLPPGPILVTAGAPRYSSQQQTVNVISGQTTQIDFALQQQGRHRPPRPPQ